MDSLPHTDAQIKGKPATKENNKLDFSNHDQKMHELLAKNLP